MPWSSHGMTAWRRRGLSGEHSLFPRSLQGSTLQSMPLPLLNDRLRVGMDAMVEPWQEQCGLGFQGNRHALFVIAGLDPAIHADCPLAGKARHVSMNFQRPPSAKMPSCPKRPKSRFEGRAARSRNEPPILRTSGRGADKTGVRGSRFRHRRAQGPDRNRRAARRRPPCRKAHSLRTGMSRPVARHRS